MDVALKLSGMIEALEEMGVTWLKLRIGSWQYWILSKEKPERDHIAGCPVRIHGEIAPGWWLWTY